jgi:hypothetical protein
MSIWPSSKAGAASLADLRLIAGERLLESARGQRGIAWPITDGCAQKADHGAGVLLVLVVHDDESLWRDAHRDVSRLVQEPVVGVGAS